MLKKSFYALKARNLAPLLLGKLLVHHSRQGTTSGLIVETEAYEGRLDLASHASRGETPRSQLMFGHEGVSYVYFSYGAHCCFNIVCHQIGEPGAVLIRALEPIDGIQLMQKRRKRTELKDLCSGPGKLCQAMGITLKENGVSLTTHTLHLTEGFSKESFAISKGPRIGITKATEKKWRFWIKGNEFVSR